MDSRTGALGGVLCLAAAIGLGLVLPSYHTGLLVDGIVYGVFAIGLNLLLGYAGLPSLGHAAYFGLGAYAAGILAVRLTDSFWLGAASGIGASMVLGALFGLLALRTTGVYFLIITLALAQVVWAVAFSWRAVTGGDDGLAGIGRPDLGIPGLALDSTHAYYFFVLAALVVALLAMRVILVSPFGRSLEGVRESATRMAALGYNVWLHKYIAFVLSCGFAGFAGVLFVYYKGFISPEAVSIVISAEVMLMVIIGGAGTQIGPLIGALLIVLLSHGVSGITERWQLVLGILYVVTMLVAPNGIIGLVQQVSVRLRRGER